MSVTTLKFTKYSFSEELDELFLIPIFDIHKGDVGFREDLLKRTIKYIKDNFKAYWFLGGDMIAAILKTSVGNVYEQTTTPEEQLMYIYRIFEGIWDRCLYIMLGNHENRILNQTSFNAARLLHELTGVPYTNDFATFSISFGKSSKGRPVTYIIHAHHGIGSGRTEGSKINNAIRIGEVLPNADIYISGHSHGNITHEDKIYLVDRQKGLIKEQKRLYIVAGSYLDYVGYPAAKALKPGVLGSPIIHLDGQKKAAYVLSGVKAHDFAEGE